MLFGAFVATGRTRTWPHNLWPCFKAVTGKLPPQLVLLGRVVHRLQGNGGKSGRSPQKSESTSGQRVGPEVGAGFRCREPLIAHGTVSNVSGSIARDTQAIPLFMAFFPRSTWSGGSWKINSLDGA